MPPATYVRYTPEVEVQQPGEQEDVAAIRKTFGQIRAYAFDKHRHGVRDAHAKSHGILAGELRVISDLPDDLRQGLFRQEATYPVVVRLSPSPGDIVPDGVAALRGMAIKVIGVPGEKLLPQLRDAVTQDFVLCSHPTIAAGDVASYRRTAVRLERASRQPEELQRAMTTAFRAGAAVLRRLGVDRPGGAAGMAKPQTHILGETFYSQAALRYGEHVAKISVQPASDQLTQLAGASVDAGNPSVLRDLVSEFFRLHTAEYQLRVQLATDLEAMPVEDASVEWSEQDSPYRTVATLVLPPQDPYSPARRVYADDVLSFNPWHGLVEHQPLGSIQRVRRPVYDDSADDRHHYNAVTRTEPDSIQALPA